MTKKLTKEDILNDLVPFLSKHSKDRSRITIEDADYEFEFGEISNVEIIKDSINELDGYWQFNFKCLHSIYATGVTTHQIPSFIQATAFYGEDADQDLNLMRITLNNIKDKIN